MPDISMCGSESCHLRARCYRNEASGTVSSGRGQSWMLFAPDQRGACNGFVPAFPGVYEPGSAVSEHSLPVQGEKT